MPLCTPKERLVGKATFDLDGALADYSQAIQIKPKYAAAYRNTGNAKRKKGDLNGANADFNQAVKLGLKSGDVAETPD